jgi:predicted enzyme related to lactoylglutathione lyase
MMLMSILIVSAGGGFAVAEFTSHTPGTFSWPELATTDQKAAVAFYRALFGWDLNEQPIGPTEMYSMFQMRGKPVAAAYTMRPEEAQTGAPPHWNAYVTVANVDESAKKAASLGAKVFAQPFDVMDAGRMAVLQDPTGAVFQIWQPNKHIGAMILNEPGALCWTELTTTDTKAAEAFYTKLLGWTAKHNAPGAPMEYTEFSVGSTPSIGMMPKPAGMPAHIPSYWMPYFQVASADASAAKAKELGGDIMVPAQDIPSTGRFAIVTDPQGAMFAVFEFKQGT